MNYKKMLAVWRKRREKALAMIAAGVDRKRIAATLGITKQRLSQIENGK